MEITQTAEHGACVKLTEHELLMINQALNEICNGLSISEFKTRIGADRDEVLIPLHDFELIMDKANSLMSRTALS